MRRRSDERFSPSTSSMDRKKWPSASPTSYMRQTAGCEICRATRTSR